MRALKIAKTDGFANYEFNKCPRCYGCLVNERESEKKDNVQRCVL